MNINIYINKFVNYIYIINIFKLNINIIITLLNHKINCKMMMPCKLVWMDEKLMCVTWTFIATWCHVLSFVTRILCDLSKVIKPWNNGMW
jgi:hypothetical protein